MSSSTPLSTSGFIGRNRNTENLVDFDPSSQTTRTTAKLFVLNNTDDQDFVVEPGDCRFALRDGLLPVSWSIDNGSHLFVGSVDKGSGGSSSIGTYLTQDAENSAGVM
jgi:hypothetical protein